MAKSWPVLFQLSLKSLITERTGMRDFCANPGKVEIIEGTEYFGNYKISLLSVGIECEPTTLKEATLGK